MTFGQTKSSAQRIVSISEGEIDEGDIIPVVEHIMSPDEAIRFAQQIAHDTDTMSDVEALRAAERNVRNNSAPPPRPHRMASAKPTMAFVHPPPPTSSASAISSTRPAVQTTRVGTMLNLPIQSSSASPAQTSSVQAATTVSTTKPIAPPKRMNTMLNLNVPPPPPPSRVAAEQRRATQMGMPAAVQPGIESRPLQYSVQGIQTSAPHPITSASRSAFPDACLPSSKGNVPPPLPKGMSAVTHREQIGHADTILFQAVQAPAQRLSEPEIEQIPDADVVEGSVVEKKPVGVPKNDYGKQEVDGSGMEWNKDKTFIMSAAQIEQLAAEDRKRSGNETEEDKARMQPLAKHTSTTTTDTVNVDDAEVILTEPSFEEEERLKDARILNRLERCPFPLRNDVEKIFLKGMVIEDAIACADLLIEWTTKYPEHTAAICNICITNSAKDALACLKGMIEIASNPHREPEPVPFKGYRQPPPRPARSSTTQTAVKPAPESASSATEDKAETAEDLDETYLTEASVVTHIPQASKAPGLIDIIRAPLKRPPPRPTRAMQTEVTLSEATLPPSDSGDTMYGMDHEWMEKQDGRSSAEPQEDETTLVQLPKPPRLRPAAGQPLIQPPPLPAVAGSVPPPPQPAAKPAAAKPTSNRLRPPAPPAKKPAEAAPKAAPSTPPPLPPSANAIAKKPVKVQGLPVPTPAPNLPGVPALSPAASRLPTGYQARPKTYSSSDLLPAFHDNSRPEIDVNAGQKQARYEQDRKSVLEAATAKDVAALTALKGSVEKDLLREQNRELIAYLEGTMLLITGTLTPLGPQESPVAKAAKELGKLFADQFASKPGKRSNLPVGLTIVGVIIMVSLMILTQ